MSFSGHGDEKLIDRVFLFAFRKDAWDVEQTLLKHFDKHRAFGPFSNDPKLPLAGRGQSELFSHDILGLDTDLYRLSDEEAEARKKAMLEANDGCLLALFGMALAPFTLGLSLLFIGGGLAGFFGSASGVRPSTKRREHPPKLKALIESLVQGSTISDPTDGAMKG